MEMPPPPWPANTDELDRWAALVAHHPVWSRVASNDGARVRAAEFAVALAWARRDGLFTLADDPWQDLDLAARTLDRLAGLTAALPAEASLSPAEATLLVCLPLLYDAFWSTRAAAERAVRPHDLTPSQDATSDRAAFERFAQSYSQPHRRAVAAVARGQRDAAEEIGWWLLHRWIGRQPAAYRPESLGSLLADSDATLRPE